MDHKAEVRQFLGSRRGRITPSQAGLPVYGGTRRVPGLRRAEVATLAGVSVEYYTRLEQGNLAGVSDEVLEAICRALHLDESERAHLFDLARAAGPGRRARRRVEPVLPVRPSIQRLLEGWTGIPALVRTGRMDVVAVNPLGRALFSEAFTIPARSVNLARFCFLDPRAGSFYADWEAFADDIVALLRTEAGRNPYDKGLTDLVEELAIRSEAFRTRWGAHQVSLHRTGTTGFHHPVVGNLQLVFDTLELPADPGLTLKTYSAEPGTASEDALKLLASWTATHHCPARTDTTSTTNKQHHPREG
ncbi:helix-turn-helix transcriptional regulator [Kocuria sp. U4B]